MCLAECFYFHYVLQEILEGRPYDAKSDLWSLGCVVHELCTLRYAFYCVFTESTYVYSTYAHTYVCTHASAWMREEAVWLGETSTCPC